MGYNFLGIKIRVNFEYDLLINSFRWTKVSSLKWRVFGRESNSRPYCNPTDYCNTTEKKFKKYGKTS